MDLCVTNGGDPVRGRSATCLRCGPPLSVSFPLSVHLIPAGPSAFLRDVRVLPSDPLRRESGLGRLTWPIMHRTLLKETGVPILKQPRVKSAWHYRVILMSGKLLRHSRRGLASINFTTHHHYRMSYQRHRRNCQQEHHIDNNERERENSIFIYRYKQTGALRRGAKRP